MAILCPQQINSIDWLSNQKSIKAPQADQTLLLQHNPLMTYQNTNEDGLLMYCRAYNQTINSDSLLVLNGTTNGISEVANYSELVVSFNLGGHQIAMNYQVATSTGGFTTSISASETVQAGQIPVEICVQSRSVTDWTVRYSISVLE